MDDAEGDACAERRERLIRRTCELMGWEYHKGPVWAALRKVATAEAVAISLDKLEEVVVKLAGVDDAARAALAEAGVVLGERESVADGIRRLAARQRDPRRLTEERVEDAWGGAP